MPKRASRGWQNYSARVWRRTRALVLIRDRELCQLHLPGCLVYAPLHARGGIPAGHAHHVRGRSTTGDDPQYIVAACANCNRKIGDPSKYDPKHTKRTDW